MSEQSIVSSLAIQINGHHYDSKVQKAQPKDKINTNGNSNGTNGHDHAVIPDNKNSLSNGSIPPHFSSSNNAPASSLMSLFEPLSSINAPSSGESSKTNSNNNAQNSNMVSSIHHPDIVLLNEHCRLNYQALIKNKYRFLTLFYIINVTSLLSLVATIRDYNIDENDSINHFYLLIFGCTLIWSLFSIASNKFQYHYDAPNNYIQSINKYLTHFHFIFDPFTYSIKHYHAPNQNLNNSPSPNSAINNIIATVENIDFSVANDNLSGGLKKRKPFQPINKAIREQTSTFFTDGAEPISVNKYLIKSLYEKSADNGKDNNRSSLHRAKDIRPIETFAGPISRQNNEEEAVSFEAVTEERYNAPESPVNIEPDVSVRGEPMTETEITPAEYLNPDLNTELTEA
jgi:hypothetical protein